MYNPNNPSGQRKLVVRERNPDSPKLLVPMSEEIKDEAYRLITLFGNEYNEIISCQEGLDTAGYNNDYDKNLFNEALALHQEVNAVLADIQENSEIPAAEIIHRELLIDLEKKHQEIVALKEAVLKNIKALGLVLIEEESSDPNHGENTVDAQPQPLASGEVPKPDNVSEVLSTADDKVDEPVSNSNEAALNSEYISQLASMYKEGNKKVFKVSGSEGGYKAYKKLKTISKEINLVLSHEGFSQDRIKHFLNEIIGRIQYDIRLNSGLRNQEQDPEKKAALATLIGNLHQELLEKVAAFLQTEKIDEEQAIEQPEPVLEETDKRIADAIDEYEFLRTQFKELGKDFRDSPAIKKIGLVLDLLRDNEREKDPTIAKIKKEKYLKTLLSEIEKFKEEAVIVPAATEESAPSQNSPEVNSSLAILEDLSNRGVIERFSYLPDSENTENTIFDFAGRKIVVAKINGRNLPFYRSLSGSSGKQAGKWYPFFGFSSNMQGDGLWFIKGSMGDGMSAAEQIKEMNNGYNYPEIQEVLRELNTNLVDSDELEGLLQKVQDKDESAFVSKINQLIGEPLPDGTEELYPHERIRAVIANLNLSPGEAVDSAPIDVVDLDQEIADFRDSMLNKSDASDTNDAPDQADPSINPAVAPLVTPLQDSQTPLDEVSSATREKLVSHYAEHRSQSIEAKKAFKEVENSYQAGLKNYYENRSLFSKALGGTRNLFGLDPKLPPELAKLQASYKEARKNYAWRLNEALEMRGFAHVGNKEFEAGSDTSKRAFGKKFIINPYQDLLNLQENILKDQEAKSRFSKILKLMSKHKKIARTVGLTAVAGIGAATGGLAGAGLGIGRWTLSTFGGAAAASYTYKRMQGGVEQANKKSQETREQATESFSLTELDKLDEAILNADSEKSRAQLRQKAAAVGTAVAVGGAAGFGTSYAFSDVGESAATASQSRPDEALSEAVNQKDSVAKEIATPALAASEPAGAASAPESASAPKASAAEETIPNLTAQHAFVREIEVEHFDGTQKSTLISNIDVRGASGVDSALIEQHRLDLEKTIKLQAGSIIANDPHITQAKLEAALLQSLEKQYGGTTWWRDAGISEIKIGKIDLIDPSTSRVARIETAPDLGENATENSSIKTDDVMDSGADPINDRVTDEAAAEIIPREYVVQKGDNLWNIMKEQYADSLKGLSPAEQNRALDALFDKARIDSDLRSTIGLGPKDDIDLIYSGNKLNLSGLGAELQDIIQDQQVKGVRLSSGMLNVSGAEEQVIDVPIVVQGSEVISDGETSVGEASPNSSKIEPPGKVVPQNIEPAPAQSDITRPVESVRPEGTEKAFVPPPRPFPIKGNYFDQPTYQAYVNEVFGGPKGFEKVLDRSINSIDDSTYDIFSRGLYDSPYSYLKDMSLEQIEKFGEKPNAQIRATLQANNMKYDTYIAWLDKIDEMKAVLPNKPETNLADLFSRYVAETEALRAKKFLAA